MQNSRNTKSSIINKSEIESIKDKFNNKEFEVRLKDININKNKNILIIKKNNININNKKKVSFSLEKKIKENEKSLSDNSNISEQDKNDMVIYKNKNNKTNYIFPLYYYFLDIVFDNLINLT